MHPQQTLALEDIDLSDPMFWTRPPAEREGAFLTLRDQDPIRFFEEPMMSELMPPGPGYYSLTRHADVLEASKHPQVFCSSKGTNIPDMPEPFLEFLGSMINMDDPRHARMRRIVSRGFTPKQLDSMKGDVEGIAAEIIDDVIERGEGDFVTDVAATLPLRIIVDMMGIPRSQEQFIFDRTNVILGLGDPEYVPDQTETRDHDRAARRRPGPRHADHGAGRGPPEGSAERPHHRAGHGRGRRRDAGARRSWPRSSCCWSWPATRRPATRSRTASSPSPTTPSSGRAWQADFDAIAPTAVEEIVRWATPVIHFRRTVTQDGVRIGEQELNEGDKVVLWYASANRDAAVFDDPYRFDLRRTPNDHLGFGGPGPHFCLGAHLARREITVMFRELFRRMPDLQAAGEPVRLQSNFINGIKHLPASWTPTAG